MNYSLQDLFKDHSDAHSELQCDSFITRNEGGRTIYGMYKQALRELRGRVNTLRRLYADFAEAKKEATQEVDTIKIYRKRCEIDSLYLSIRSKSDEAARFYAQCCLLKEQLPELTPQTIKTLDEGMWADKLLVLAAESVESTGVVSSSILQLIRSLPFHMRLPLTEKIREPELQKQLVDGEGSSDYSIDLPAMISQEEVRELVYGADATNKHIQLSGPENTPIRDAMETVA